MSMRTGTVQVYTGTDKTVYINTEDPYVKDNWKSITIHGDYYAKAFDSILIDSSVDFLTIQLPKNPMRGDKIEFYLRLDRYLEVNVDPNGKMTTMSPGWLNQTIKPTPTDESAFFKILYTGEDIGWILIGIG